MHVLPLRRSSHLEYRKLHCHGIVNDVFGLAELLYELKIIVAQLRQQVVGLDKLCVVVPEGLPPRAKK